MNSKLEFNACILPELCTLKGANIKMTQEEEDRKHQEDMDKLHYKKEMMKRKAITIIKNQEEPQNKRRRCGDTTRKVEMGNKEGGDATRKVEMGNKEGGEDRVKVVKQGTQGEGQSGTQRKHETNEDYEEGNPLTNREDFENYVPNVYPSYK